MACVQPVAVTGAESMISMNQHRDEDNQVTRVIQQQPADCPAALRARLASKEQQLQQLQQEIHRIRAELQAAQAMLKVEAAATDEERIVAALAVPEQAVQSQLVASRWLPHSTEKAGVAGVANDDGSSSLGYHAAAAPLVDSNKAVQDNQDCRMQHLVQHLQDAAVIASGAQVGRARSVFDLRTPEISAPMATGGTSAAAATAAITAVAVLQELSRHQKREPQLAANDAAAEQSAEAVSATGSAVLQGVQQMIPQLHQQHQQSNNTQLQQGGSQQVSNMQQQQQQQQRTMSPLNLEYLEALVAAVRIQQQQREQQHQQTCVQQQDQQGNETSSQPADQYLRILHALQPQQCPPASTADTMQQNRPLADDASDAVECSAMLPAATPESSPPAAAEVAAAVERVSSDVQPETALQTAGSSSSSSQQPFLHPLVATAAAATATAATQLEIRTAAHWDNASTRFKDRCLALATAAAQQQTAAGVGLESLGWQEVMLLMQPIEEELRANDCLGKPIDVASSVVVEPGSQGAASAGPVLGYYDFAQYFTLPAVAAARAMGMGLTKFKGKIRQIGIARWPGREYKAIEEAIDFLHSKGDDARDHALKPMRILLLKHLKCLLDKYPNMNLMAHPARDLIDALHKQKYKKKKQEEKEHREIAEQPKGWKRSKL